MEENMKPKVLIIFLIIFCLIFATIESVNVNTASGDPLVRAVQQGDYDVNKFKHLLVLGFGDEQSTVAYSPSEDKLAVGDATGIIHIIDPQSSYKAEAQLYLPEAILNWSVDYHIMDISWSLDGKKIAAAYSDGTIKIWDTITGECLKNFPAHNNNPRSISWSPDGTKIASCSNFYSYSGGKRSNDTIKIWDGNTTELLKTIHYGKNVCDIAWDPDSSMLASCCDFESSVMIWNVSTGKCIKDIQNSEHCRRIVWSPDGTKLITGGDKGNVWDAKSGNILKTFNYSVHSPSVSPDGSKIAMTTSKNNSIEIWDMLEWELLNAFGDKIATPFGKMPPTSISWSHESMRIAVGYLGYVEVYDITTGGLVISIDPVEGSKIARNGDYFYSSYYFAWSHDATKLMWSAFDTITIWDLTTGGLRKLQGNNSIRGISLSPDGTKIAVASFKNSIEIWDLVSGECLKTLAGYSGPGDPYIGDVAWGPKSDTLLASFGGLSYSSGVVQIWNLTTYNCTKTIFANTYFVDSVSWSPDGTKFAYDCGPTVNIWDIESDTYVRTFTGNGHTGSNWVSWSPDGAKLLYGADQEKVIVQNLEENTTVILENISDLLFGSWSPDSTMIGGSHGIWNATSGKFIRSMRCDAISWSPDGNKIASAASSEDSTVRIWGEDESVIPAGLYYGYPPPIIVGASISKYICKKSETLEIRGYVIDNTSAPVLNVNVTIKILETGNEWSTITDSNGDYSKTITAPNTPGNYTIRVGVTWNNHTDWKQMRLTVKEAITNGEEQGDQGVIGEEGPLEWRTTYLIAIIGAVVGGIIVAFALLRLKKPEVTKVEKAKEERKLDIEFPSKIQTMTLRCPECKMTFSVEVKPKPFGVKCPNCGKEGTIK